jgi:hypothetical protein
MAGAVDDHIQTHTQEIVMFSKSSFLAVTLGLTAIGSATFPATAKPSQHLGSVRMPASVDASPKSAALHPIPTRLHEPMPASTAGLKSQITKLPMPGASAGKLQPLPAQLPMPGASAGKTQPLPAQYPIPGAQAGKTQPLPSQYPIPTPDPIPAPPSGKPIDDICPFNPLKCSPTPANAGGKKPTGGGAGPVVILAPQLPIEFPVPVSVPVSAPVSTVAVGTAVAQTTPSIKPTAGNCGTAIPALGAAIDELLPTAQLSDADRTSVIAIRQLIQVLGANGKVAAARDAEEVAMNTLGYKKVWLRCGTGSFTWATQDGPSQ